MLPGSSEVKLGDLAGLEARLAKGDVAAFVFEPIQGKGVNIASNEYLLGAQALCRKYGTLMVCDEVQSGMGRTGRFLASQWIEGLRPDVICLSKALSGGYIPVGATITRRAVYDSVYDGMHRAIVHASTFGMGNMAMAGRHWPRSTFWMTRILPSARSNLARVFATVSRRWCRASNF